MADGLHNNLRDGPRNGELEAENERLRGLLRQGQEERQAIERAMQEQQAALTALLRSSPLVIYRRDAAADGSFHPGFVSDNVFELLGYRREEVLDDPDFWGAHLHPDDAPRVGAADEALLDHGQNIVEYRFRRRDGAYLSLHDERRLERDEAGRPRSIVGSWLDITERQEAEQRLRLNENKYRSVLETTSEGYWMIDPATRRTIEVNQSLCNILGYRAEEIVGHSPMEFVDETNRAILLEQTSRISSTDHRSYELALRHKSGVNIPCMFHASTVRDEGGRPLYAVALVTNIQELKAIELELLKASERAEAASRAKSEFLANMSHEIRTPMNAIINLSYLALQSGLTPKQHDYISKVKRAGEGLLGIVNDILDVAKVESGKLLLHYSNFDLKRLLHEVYEMFSLAAADKGLSLRLELDGIEHYYLVGDPLRVRQILINLVGNAIKFTERGEVTVRASEAPQGDDDNARFEFAVRDTGIGIGEAQQRQLFTPFSQVDGSTTRKYGGTGLGLSISRQLAEMMGGDIALDSEYGEGSSFVLRLPFKLGTAPDKTAQSLLGDEARARLQALRGASILLVEDNLPNQMVAREFLEGRGMQVTVADHGAVALQWMRSTHFDLIFMDLQMPEMDGYEATQAIRQLPQGRDIPIIAMTAHAMSDEQRRCLQAGMNDHMAKPFDVEQLDRILLRWLPAPQGGPVQRETTMTPTPSSATPQAIDGIDLDDALRRIGGNWKAYKRVVTVFRDTNRGFLQRLEAELAAGDLEAASRSVHTLKGVAGTIGAKGLQQRALELEGLLKDGGGNASDQVALLAVELTRVFAGIARLEEGEGAAAMPIEAPFDVDKASGLLMQLITLLDEDVISARRFVDEEMMATFAQSVHGPALRRIQGALSDYEVEEALELSRALLAACCPRA